MKTVTQIFPDSNNYMINVSDIYNRWTLGNFNMEQKLESSVVGEGVDAAEEPPAWIQLDVKRCTLYLLSVAHNKRKMDSPSATAAFRCANPLLFAHMLPSFFLKLIITQRGLSFRALCSLHESA